MTKKRRRNTKGGRQKDRGNVREREREREKYTEREGEI